MLGRANRREAAPDGGSPPPPEARGEGIIESLEVVDLETLCAKYGGCQKAAGPPRGAQRASTRGHGGIPSASLSRHHHGSLPRA